jgi:hypothetical protein
VDPFTFIVAGGLGALIVALLLIGRFYPGSGADVLDWKPTRSVELEAELELDDIDQMLEAQNERRRRRGEPERTKEDVEADVAADLREAHARREAALEEQDLTQMLELENERRARKGRPPVTAEEFRAEVESQRAP